MRLLPFLLIAVCRPVVASFTDDSVHVSTFSALEEEVAGGTAQITIRTPELLFPHQIDVREDTAVTIMSLFTTLDGGGSTRLFFLRNNSKLCLRGVHLAEDD